MIYCIAGICAGLALVWAFPKDSLLSWLGTLFFVGSAVALLVLFLLSIVRSVSTKRWQARQALAAVFLVVLASFVVRQILPLSDATQVERTITTVSTSTDPAYCELTTLRYLEQVTGQNAQFADDACEREAPNRGADEVSVDEIEIDGDRASAVVDNVGGSFDGSRLVVSLIEKEGDWRLDSLDRFVRFDRMRFRRRYMERLGEFGLPDDAVRCVLARGGRLSDAEVQRALLHPGSRIFAEFVVDCDREAVERVLLKPIATPDFEATNQEVRCVERRLDASTDSELLRLQLNDGAYSRVLADCARDALNAYHRQELLDTTDLDQAAAECTSKKLRRLSNAAFIRATADKAEYAKLIEMCQAES